VFNLAICLKGLHVNYFRYDRVQQLRNELIDLARNGTPQDRDERRLDAENTWSEVKYYPILMIGFLVILSTGAAGICFSGGAGSYIGLGIFTIALFTGVFWLNKRHQEAYIVREIAHGKSRIEAEREYRKKYQES
jgi:hypothetical protein